MTTSRLVMQNLSRSRIALILAGTILAAGLGLRIASFGWNTRIKGDVNLMALTAREFIQHDRLYYPMIYGRPEVQRFMTADPIGTPATQHPPLYPFMAGLIGKLTGSDDTFSLLKLIDELGGLALLAAIAWAGLKPEVGWEWLGAGALAAVSPILVDFSANGSPYILSALSVLLATLLLRSFRMDSLRDYILAGLIGGIGLQFHNVLVGLPAAFAIYWIIERKRIRWAGVGVFIATLALTLAPWIAWNMAMLGVPMMSTSTNYVLQQLKITSFSQMVEPEVALRYFRLLFGTLKLFVKEGFLEAGPFAVSLALAGGYFLARHDRRNALAIGLPGAVYLAVTLLWPVFKLRFLAPALIPLFIMAGYGFIHLPDLFPKRERAARIAAWALAVGCAGWSLAGFFNTPPTRYYEAVQEGQIAKNYPLMQSLATQVSQRPPGVILCVSNRLDSGIETVYWTRLRSTFSAATEEKMQARAEQYHPRYVWADDKTRETIEKAFPTAQLILSNEPFFVYEIP